MPRAPKTVLSICAARRVNALVAAILAEGHAIGVAGAAGTH
jgi:hypothetical protein